VGAGLKAYICKVTSRKIAINTILQWFDGAKSVHGIINDN
jgi:hypothetical protein